MAGTERKCAPHQPTVDRSERIQAFKKAFYSDTSDSEDEALRGQVTQLGTLRHRRRRRPVRPRTKLPKVPDISEDDLLFESSDESKREVVTSKKIPTEVTNSPDGLQLKINLADLLANRNVSVNDLLEAAGVKSTGGGVDMIRSDFFVVLPAEICQRIYRQLFVIKDRPIIFSERKDFQRSAQILRTCRKIYEEGTLVLYGENSFHFSRARQVKGVYYEEIWNDLGFRDVRQFLIDIGPCNMAKLRFVSFHFEDSTVTLSPGQNSDERYFANDAVLVHCLTMLAKYTQLDKLALGFRGKRGPASRDHHFLQALCTIRCHHLIEDAQHGRAINAGTWNTVKRLCEIPADPNSNVNQELNKVTPAMYHERVHW